MDMVHAKDTIDPAMGVRTVPISRLVPAGSGAVNSLWVCGSKVAPRAAMISVVSRASAFEFRDDDTDTCRWQ